MCSNDPTLLPSLSHEGLFCVIFHISLPSHSAVKALTKVLIAVRASEPLGGQSTADPLIIHMTSVTAYTEEMCSYVVFTASYRLYSVCFTPKSHLVELSLSRPKQFNPNDVLLRC